jgi:hypothetical protein
LTSRSEFAKDGLDDAANGWQEIASLLGCSVRTAQRWAKAGGFSVYKVPGTKPLRVCARRAEVGTWRERNSFPWCTAQGTGLAQEALTGAVKHHKYIWGWKAIAGLLNLSVSTVQLWEREAKMPVHRLKTGRRAFPYVLEDEILAWINEGTASAQTTSKVDTRLPLLMHSFLDTWPAHIAVLDTTGTIIAVNKAWRSFSRSNGYSEPNFGIGRKYFEVCASAACTDAATASQVLNGVADFLAGKCADLKVQYRCDGPTENRDFLLTATRFEGLTSPFFVICHSDVTNVIEARTHSTMKG